MYGDVVNVKPRNYFSDEIIILNLEYQLRSDERALGHHEEAISTHLATVPERYVT